MASGSKPSTTDLSSCRWISAFAGMTGTRWTPPTPIPDVLLFRLTRFEAGKGGRKLRKYLPGTDDQEVLDDGEDTLLPRRQGPLRLEQRAGAGAHGRAWRYGGLPHPRGLRRTGRARLRRSRALWPRLGPSLPARRARRDG